jgi:hypothetical protein
MTQPSQGFMLLIQGGWDVRRSCTDRLPRRTGCRVEIAFASDSILTRPLGCLSWRRCLPSRQAADSLEAFQPCELPLFFFWQAYPFQAGAR